MKLSAKGGGDFFRLRFWAAGLLMLGMFLMSGMGEANAAPLAGTSIGNQASATYTDNGGVSRITVSNTVTTTVQPVSAATLNQSQTKVGAPGQPLNFPHNIVNNGNSPESYTLSVSAPAPGGNTVTATPLLFADANCDGVPDNATQITSVGPAAPGTQVCFVAQAQLNTTGATPSTFTVGAVSSITSLAITNSPNTDTAVITNAGVITVTKSISVSSGPVGTVVTYTLTYRNTGTQTATGVVLDDLLQTGVTVTPTIAGLVPTWSGGPVTSLNTINGSTPNRINVSVNTNGGTSRVVAVIESVAPNTQGTFSFQATEGGTASTNFNASNYCYNDGTAYQPSAVVAVATACGNIVTGSGVTSGTTSGTYSTILDNNASIVAGTTNTNTSNTVPFSFTGSPVSAALILNDGSTGLSTAPSGGNGTANAGNPLDGTNQTTPATAAGQSDATGTQTGDVNLASPVSQGTAVVFNNWIWNTGTGADTYNIAIIDGGLAGSPQFPTGTSFLLFRSDGTTPLTDSDGDGVLDTGPVPGAGSTCQAGSPNATSSATAGVNPCGYRVVVRAILPSNAAGTYNVVIRASSSATPTTTNYVTDRVVVNVASVDLRNPKGLSGDYAVGSGVAAFTSPCSVTDLSPAQGTCSVFSNGANPGGQTQTAAGEANAVTSIAANPGTQVKFKLDVANTGVGADSYDLGFNVGNGAWTLSSTTATWTTPGALPTGFQLRFFADGGAGNCSTLGASQITNTGVIAAGATKLVCAVVDVAAGTAPVDVKLYFRVVSPTTVTATTGSSADVKYDLLRINTLRSVTITPNNAGQIFPGGSIQYCHTVTNAGNVDEGPTSTAGSTVGLANTNSLSPLWPANATLYRDTNNNCVLDDSATPFTAGNISTILTHGTSQNFIVVVQAPTGAVAGSVNVTSITVTVAGAVFNGVAAPPASTATDSTTVVIGQVALTKSQVLDPTGQACSTGMTTGAVSALTFTTGPITTNAKPGWCIFYKIVAQNIGTQPVTQVQLNDTSPQYTTCYGPPFLTSSIVTPPTINVSPTVACTPGTDGTASLSTTTVTLQPNDTITLYFRVRINP
jgi:uncharacterized repeat protein (TIGR01451 family)